MRRKTIAAGLLALGMVTTGTVVANASTPVDWYSKVCAGASRYVAHPSERTLDAINTDSMHLRRSYTRADIGQLYADASSPSPKAAKYVKRDLTYISQDCASPVLH